MKICWKALDNNIDVTKLCKVDLTESASGKSFDDVEISPVDACSGIDLIKLLLSDSELSVFVL